MSNIRTKQLSGAFCRSSAILVLLILAVAVLNASCSKSDSSTEKSGKSPAVPVTAAPIVQKDVPLELSTFGKAQSKASVTIKSKVTQIILSVHFQAGDKISRGDLLFSLDSHPYEVALANARAALSRDKVLFADAQLAVQRNKELLDKKMLSQEEYDKAKSVSEALAETLKADQAAIDAAQIGVDNCRITSPIDGRAGKVLVHAGNLVTADDVPLVMINQITPIDVFFSLPQAEFDRVRDYQSKANLAVEAVIPGEPERPENGFLTFIDNRIDPSNGTIEIGATFPNPDERLWPGSYVLINLMLTIQRDAVVAPLRAIVTGISGQYVFVVKQDQTAEMRTVKVVRTMGDDAVIETGLQPGEQVVTDGQLQLEDGTRLEINSGETKSALPIESTPANTGITP
jgi:membrane fusion protein, multidrug efflux system